MEDTSDGRSLLFPRQWNKDKHDLRICVSLQLQTSTHTPTEKSSSNNDSLTLITALPSHADDCCWQPGWVTGYANPPLSVTSCITLQHNTETLRSLSPQRRLKKMEVSFFTSRSVWKPVRVHFLLLFGTWILLKGFLNVAENLITCCWKKKKCKMRKSIDNSWLCFV